MRVAAYCRVSTDQEEQLLSYENQVRFYTESINSNPEYECARIYADEGISGTNTKKRDEFNRMIMDCRAGKIDRIITKSISRFVRNTLDCLNYVRELKRLGIGVTFEKEAIDTLDAKGEVLLTILSSLAQDESRNISENSTWGIRKRFEIGQHKMSTKRFLGYDADENGKLVVNKQQAKIVKRIFMDFLWGKTTDYIKQIFEREGVINWDGGTRWQSTTIASMPENENVIEEPRSSAAWVYVKLLVPEHWQCIWCTSNRKGDCGEINSCARRSEKTRSGELAAYCRCTSQ